MTINDVREMAVEKNIPIHAISSILSEIETDENGNVKDKLEVVLALNEIAHNYDRIRSSLAFVKSLKEKRKQ